MKIGVLYPRSIAHPNMMADFIDGIKSVLKHDQLTNDVHLIADSIGFGGQEKEIFEKAEKLLSLEAVDVLVAYIDQRVISIVEPLVLASGKLMIVVNPGANYPENWVPQPSIIYLTLQHSFLCWLTGLLAAKSNSGGATVATCFYDCGYLHTAAMVKSYMDNGGNILFNYVNNDSYNDTFQIKPLTDFLSADKEFNNLLCLFDEKPASLFYDRLNKFEESSRLHLFVSPMMLEQKAREAGSVGFNFSIEGYLPYHASDETKTNIEFRKIIVTETKREASLFSLLGWETAQIIKEVFNHCKNKFEDGVFIAEHLATKTITSPRGNLKLDKETHHFLAPVFKGTIKKHSSNIEIVLIENVEEELKKFIDNPVVGPSSGWTNTYLCY